MDKIQIIIEQVNKGEAITQTVSALKQMETAENKVETATRRLNQALDQGNSATVAARIKALASAQNELAQKQQAYATAAQNSPAIQQAQQAQTARNQQVIAEMRLNDQVQAQLDKNDRAAAESAERLTGAHRQTREAIMALAGSVRVLQTALGDQLDPAAKKVVDDLGVITSTAMMGASVMGPLGAGIGLVAGSLAVLARNANEVDPKIKALHDDLAKTIDEIKTLTDLKGIAGMAKDLGVSEDALRKFIGTQSEGEFQATVYAKSQAMLKDKTNELAVARKKLADAEKEYQADKGSTLEAAAAGYVKQYADQVQLLEHDIHTLTTAQNDAATAIQTTTAATIEHNRVIDLFKTNLPQAVQAQKQYTQQLAEMRDAHKEAQAGFRQDILNAEKDLGTERAKIAQQADGDILKSESDLAAERAKINADLLTKLGDMEQQQNNKKSDGYYDYAKSIRELERNITTEAQNQAAQRVQIEADAQKQIRELDYNAGKSLADAKTEDERERILKDAQHARTGIQQKAQDDLAKLRETSAAKDEEFRHRRDLMDEEYRHSQELSRRDYTESIARLQRDTQAQLDAANQKSQADIVAIQVRATADMKAQEEQTRKTEKEITKRATAEDTAFQKNKKKLDDTLGEQIKTIGDVRNDTTKLAADMASLAGTAWEPWLTQVREYRNELLGLPTTNEDYGTRYPGPRNAGQASPTYSGGGTYRPQGYASGGSFVVPMGYPNDTYVARFSSGEQVDVTPAGRASNVTRTGIVWTGNIIVNGAQDPMATAREIKRQVNEILENGAYG